VCVCRDGLEAITLYFSESCERREMTVWSGEAEEVLELLGAHLIRFNTARVKLVCVCVCVCVYVCVCVRMCVCNDGLVRRG